MPVRTISVYYLRNEYFLADIYLSLLQRLSPAPLCVLSASRNNYRLTDALAFVVPFKTSQPSAMA